MWGGLGCAHRFAQDGQQGAQVPHGALGLLPHALGGGLGIVLVRGARGALRARRRQHALLQGSGVEGEQRQAVAESVVHLAGHPLALGLQADRIRQAGRGSDLLLGGALGTGRGVGGLLGPASCLLLTVPRAQPQPDGDRQDHRHHRKEQHLRRRHMGHGFGVRGCRDESADRRVPSGAVARVAQERHQRADGEQGARCPGHGIAQGSGPANHGGEGDEPHRGVQVDRDARKRRGDRDRHRPAPTYKDRHEENQPYQEPHGIEGRITYVEGLLVTEVISQCTHGVDEAQSEQAGGAQNLEDDLEGAALRLGQRCRE